MKFWKLYRDGAFLYSFGCDMVAAECMKMLTLLDPDHFYSISYNDPEPKCGDTYG